MNHHEAPLAGEVLVLSVTEFARRFRTLPTRIYEYINRGLIESGYDHPQSRGKSIKCPRDADWRYFYDLWCERQDTFADHATLKTHAFVCGRFHISWPYHEKVVQGVGDLIRELGDINNREIAGLIPIKSKDWPSIKREVLRRAGLHATPRRAQKTAKMGLAKAVKMLKPAMRSIPRTCLDPDPIRRLSYGVPSEAQLGRAALLGPMAAAAIVGLVVLASLKTSHRVCNIFIRTLERNADIVARYVPGQRWSRRAMRLAFERYILDPDEDDQEATLTRVTHVLTYERFLKKLHRFAARQDGELAERLRIIFPKRPELTRTCRTQINRRRKAAELQAHATRKARTNPETPDLNSRSLACRSRARMMRTIGDALRLQLKQMGDKETVTVPVIVQTLDARGLPTGGQQVELFRIWKRRALWASLQKGADRVARYTIDKKCAGTKIVGHVVEHVETVPFGQEETVQCWMVALARSFCLTYSVSALDVTAQRKRHEMLVANKLSGVKPSDAGLLTFGLEDSAMARYAARSSIHLVPIFEIEAAIRLAGLAVDVGMASRHRWESIVQLTTRLFSEDAHDRESQTATQFVIPKATKGGDPKKLKRAPISIDFETLEEALELCELHKSTFGFDAHPLVAPPDDLAWKLPPDKYIFSWGGRIIGMQKMKSYIDYLTLGWTPLSIQDLRNCLAEEADDEGEPELITMASLAHELVEDTRNYRDRGLKRTGIGEANDGGADHG